MVYLKDKGLCNTHMVCMQFSMSYFWQAGLSKETSAAIVLDVALQIMEYMGGKDERVVCVNGAEIYSIYQNNKMTIIGTGLLD